MAKGAKEMRQENDTNTATQCKPEEAGGATRIGDGGSWK